jgi:MFS family permease
VAPPRLHPDLSPLRESRDLRLVIGCEFAASLGSQATLVALPYQLYVQTHSALLVGLLGAVELAPLIATALLAGAIADRMDRRRLLLFAQFGLMLAAAGLAAAAFAGHPPVGVLYALGGVLAGFNSLQNVAASSVIPNLVTRERLRAALALNYGLYQLTMVVGPALGGLIIGAAGVQWAYAVNAIACLLVAGAIVALAPQPPHGAGETPDTILRSIVEGLRHVPATGRCSARSPSTWWR